MAESRARYPVPPATARTPPQVNHVLIIADDDLEPEELEALDRVMRVVFDRLYPEKPGWGTNLTVTITIDGEPPVCFVANDA